MEKDIIKLIKNSEALLSNLEGGEIYHSDQLAKRFDKIASLNSKDLFINKMSEVINNISKRTPFISQSDVAELYNKLYGFSGSTSTFKAHFNDLMPPQTNIKVAYPNVSSRVPLEKKIEAVEGNKSLSDAFSVLFSLGNQSVGTYKTLPSKNIEKTVFNKFNSLGYKPFDISVIGSNEHFSLCSVTLKTAANKNINLYIPVQTTGGHISEPEHIVNASNEIEELNAENIMLTLKEKESTKKTASKAIPNQIPLASKSVPLPAAFKDLENLDKVIVAALDNFDHNKINLASSMLDFELKSLGLKPQSIKVADSNNKELVFKTNILSKIGSVSVEIPVEISENIPLIPKKFYIKNANKSFNFSHNGFEEFFNTLTSDHQAIKIARDSGPLKNMNYSELINEILSGVASKNYNQAEDALSIIESKFGSEKLAHAYAEYTNLIKISSIQDDARNNFIKNALDRGDLVKRPNYSELFCPKLGLPLSKVTFDNKGRVISLQRTKLNNLGKFNE